MTKQIFPFFFYFISFITLYSPLTLSLTSARELKTFTPPLPYPSPPRANSNLYPLPPPTLKIPPSTAWSPFTSPAKFFYEVCSFMQKAAAVAIVVRIFIIRILIIRSPA